VGSAGPEGGSPGLLYAISQRHQKAAGNGLMAHKCKQAIDHLPTAPTQCVSLHARLFWQ
jgi:hypothetical protein